MHTRGIGLHDAGGNEETLFLISLLSQAFLFLSPKSTQERKYMPLWPGAAAADATLATAAMAATVHDRLMLTSIDPMPGARHPPMEDSRV